MEAKLFDNGIPQILPVYGHDRFHYTVQHVSSNAQIQMVISFDQHLDSDILKRAIRLSMDVEPILGCRFVEDDKQPYWQRFEHLDNMPWFEFTLDAKQQEAVERFLIGQFYVPGQLLNIRLIRTGSVDTLCVKICHACSDAGGLKQYLGLLSDIYSELLVNPGFKPVPNIQGRRDQRHYFEALGINDPMSLFDPQNQPPPATWAFPYHELEKRQINVALRRISNENFERLIAFGKAHETTVNTILLTAFSRSLFELIKPPLGEEMGVGMTMDLRQTFKDNPNQAISNLSVTMEPRIARLDNEPFQETLRRLSLSIADLKNARADLRGAIGIEVFQAVEFPQCLGIIQAVWQQMIETGKSTPTLSNMGIISPVQFGKITSRDAYLVTPAIAPPGVLMAASTYNKTLTLEASYHEPAHKKEEIESCLELMEKELSSLEL